MSRRFTAASNERIAIGSAGLAGFNFTYGTFAVVANNFSLPANASYFSTNNATGACANFALSSGVMALYDGNLSRTGQTLSTGVTYVFGFTKATGTATARHHSYNPTTNAWTHQAASGTNVDGATATILVLGAFADATASEPIDADVFAIGFWQGVVMTDSEFERLARGNWLNYSPDFYEQWTDGRDTGDMMTTLGRRGSKQTARTGTTRGTTKPPAGFRFAVQRRRR